MRKVAAAAVVAGAAGAMAAAGPTVAPLLRFLPGPVQRLVARYIRLVWPPRRQNAVVYVGAWAAIMGIFFATISTARSKEAEWEKSRKRKYCEASLRNLLDYEKARLQEQADAERQQRSEDSAKVNGDATSEAQDSGDAPKPKKPPDAKRMIDLLFDEVENGNITLLGVDKNLTWYQKSVALLKERVEAELRDAIDKTMHAQKIMQVGSTDPAVLKEMDDWHDGEKLHEHVKLVTDRVYKAFGKQLVDRSMMKEARNVLTLLGLQKKVAVRRIWQIFRPQALHWVIGTLLLACAEVAAGFLEGNLVALAQLAFELQPDTMARTGRSLAMWAVGFAFYWPMDNLGNALVDEVQTVMQLGLRQAVLTSLLCQDREYFDHHQTGVLQDRLNNDTEKLASTIIQQPKNLFTALAKVVAKSMFLYKTSPALFWTGVLIPGPFCVILNTFSWTWVRRADVKVGKVNDHANGSTSEILREINTVRQFGMELEEANRYGIISRWRGQLEFSIRKGQRWFWFLMLMAWFGARGFNTYRGISLVIQQRLYAAQLAVAIYQFDGIVWGVRQVVDLVPAVAQMMQPMTRVAMLLDTAPKIEPSPDRPQEKEQLRPERLSGRIEFTDVDFTYPSERQKQVLYRLSFVVEPRTKIAFVGKAGCGKSTCVTLLQRFYNPSHGTITLDGQPLSDYDVYHLRRNIGVVAQDNVLFSTSILENICYGMGQGHLPHPSMEDVWAACDAANVTEFVHSFPNGLHTFVGTPLSP